MEGSGGQIATMVLIRTENKQEGQRARGSVSHRDGKRKVKIWKRTSITSDA